MNKGQCNEFGKKIRFDYNILENMEIETSIFPPVHPEPGGAVLSEKKEGMVIVHIMGPKNMKCLLSQSGISFLHLQYKGRRERFCQTAAGHERNWGCFCC